MPLPVESVEGKAILVTGANRGIGLATVKELAKRGAKVIAGVRDPAKMPNVSENVAVLELDAADAQSCASFIERALEQEGKIDGLINNAGILLDKGMTILDLDHDVLRSVMEVNLVGPLRLCQLVIPGMMKRGCGRVVNISSGLGSITDMGANFPSYRLSKLALNGLTRILAVQLDPAVNVKVNSLCPGWVRTDMGGQHAMRDPSEPAREIADLISIGSDGPTGGVFRYGEPAEW